MKMTNELFMQIRFLHTFEHLSSAQISQKLGLPERTVRNWWNEDFFPVKMNRIRHRLIKPYEKKINSLLAETPTLSGTQLYQRLKKYGFTGSVDVVRRYLSHTRPETRKTYLELSFEPGEAVQIDFGECGMIQYEGHRIQLKVLAMVLCYSRMMYAELIPSEKLEFTLAGISNGFEFFGGVPRKLIVDNFRGAVESHPAYGPVVYNKEFLDFCNHYGTLPWACNVYSPYEKGRIERGIGYIKDNFFKGAKFSSLNEAKHALSVWLDDIANVRIHGTTRKQPKELFESEEKGTLLPLSGRRYESARILTRTVDSQCRISCDGNRYSVPARFAYKMVTVRMTEQKILIYHEGKLIASHLRIFTKGNSVVDPDHVKIMLNERMTAARQNLKSDFLALGPGAAKMLDALQSRIDNPEDHMKKILLLADKYGRDKLTAALECAVENHVCGADYVEMILRQKSQPVENALGHLHVTRGADNLEVQVASPDLNAYDLFK